MAIAGLEKEWTARPVLHLDLNTEKFDEPESLRRVLDRHLLQWEKLYGVESGDPTPWGRFNN